MPKGRDGDDYETRIELTLASLVRLCAHPYRLRLLQSLAAAEKEVSALAKELGASMSVTSRHLEPLEAHGLVEYRPFKSWHLYRLGPRVIRAPQNGMLHLRLDSTDGQSLELHMHTRHDKGWQALPRLHGFRRRTGY